MLKQIVRDQYRSKFDLHIDLKNIICPKEGWIRTLRKALGMSSPQLARRLGMSKSRASQMERMEIEDRITLNQLRRVANALDCELVYALVPHKSIEAIVRERAELKAKKLVSLVDSQMKLEQQQLAGNQIDEQLRREIDRLMRDMPRDLWEE